MRLQAAFLEDARLQPFVNHPTQNAVGHSPVEKGAQGPVRDRVEIIAPVDFEHPPELLLYAGVAQTLQRLMCLASWSEAERAVQEVLSCS